MYSEGQEDYDKVKTISPKIEFMKGYSNKIYNSFEPNYQYLLIVDDQISQTSNTKSRANLFYKK